MKIWYFHGQYITNGLGSNENCIIFLITSHEQISCRLPEEKQKYLYICVCKESGKIFENEAAEPYLEPCQISVMERFCENTTAKSFIIDLRYGCKYTPEVVQDYKINLK